MTCTVLDLYESYDSVLKSPKLSKNEVHVFCTFQVSLEIFMDGEGSSNSRNTCQMKLLQQEKEKKPHEKMLAK